MRSISLLIFIVTLHTLSACTSSTSTISFSGRSNLPLPDPKFECVTEDASWNGLRPLQSSLENVTEILGQPDVISNERIGDKEFTYYGYFVKSDVFSSINLTKDEEPLMHKIYFRQNGLVDRMQIIDINNEGGFNQVQHYSSEFGNTLDTVMYNGGKLSPRDTRSNSTPVVFSPSFNSDMLYVWSECGIVLNAVGKCKFPDRNADCVGLKSPIKVQGESNNTLLIRIEDPMMIKSDINTSDLVLMKIIFPPTTYDGFLSYYYGTIPSNNWNDDAKWKIVE